MQCQNKNEWGLTKLRLKHIENTAITIKRIARTCGVAETPPKLKLTPVKFVLTTRNVQFFLLFNL